VAGGSWSSPSCVDVAQWHTQRLSRQTHTRIAQTGCDVKVSTRNVSDPNDALALISEAGSGDVEGVGGVFNLAVVLQDGLTVNQEAAQWIRAAEPKVELFLYCREGVFFGLCMMQTSVY
jgi:hypothetical protein